MKLKVSEMTRKKIYIENNNENVYAKITLIGKMAWVVSIDSDDKPELRVKSSNTDENVITYDYGKAKDLNLDYTSWVVSFANYSEKTKFQAIIEWFQGDKFVTKWDQTSELEKNEEDEFFKEGRFYHKG